jgi:protein HOOK3
MLQHVQNERQRLLNDLRNMESANETLKTQVNSLKEKSSLNEQEREALDGTERQRSSAVELQNAKLQKELDECKRDLDLKIVETDNLKSEVKLTHQRLDASREIQAKLEMENHHQADELDVARDKLSKLAKAEQAVEKYQKRLEEMMVLKKQNKELTDKIDQYLDQIHELESTNKGFANMNKMVENYKNRAIELEREKFEAISNAEISEQQLQQANQENKKLSESKNRLDDEVRSLQSQMQLLQEQEEEKKSFSGLGLEEEATETVPQLKEKVKKLERQLRQQQQDHSSSAGSEMTADSLSLQQELDEVRAIKKEREEALMAAKRQIVELQNENSKLQRSREEQVKESSNTQALKEATQKLAATSNTVKLLEEKLKERETVINKLQQERAKLENYAKRSLETFKEKYLAVLKTVQQEKKEMVEKIKLQAERLEKNQETWRREERLLSSALFECGVKIIDKRIQSQLHEPVSLQQNTFLSLQREALAKSASDPSRGSEAIRLQQSTSTPLK